MKKRASGEGTIRQLASGRWSWKRMIGRNEYGTPIYERLTADTQKDLLKAIEEYKQNKAKATDFDPPLRISDFKSFSDDWFKSYVPYLRISTQHSYHYTLKKLQEYWGDTPVDKIHPSHITNMIQHFSDEGLSSSYLKKLQSMMYQIMDHAEGEDLIRKNPVRFVRSHKTDDFSVHKDAFTPEELKKLNMSPTGKVRDFTLLSCATGMRTQELLALRGNDIAVGGVSISINKAVNMAANIPVMGETKNTSSRRVIPVPSAVQRIADKYRVYGDSLIWQSPQVPNRTINPSTYRAAFKRFCKAANVRPLTPHCCRHTYVTQLHAHGVDMMTIKVLAGHSRHDVTEGYTHVSWEFLSAAADKLNDLFNDKNTV